jgi:thiol-disulfide isomerase/thioredoxin
MPFRPSDETDETILADFWDVSTSTEIDPRKRFIKLTGEMYNEEIVDPSTGLFVSERPWFIVFIVPRNQYCQMMKDHLERLAAHYDGSIQFAWINVNEDELLKLSYSAYKPPRSHFLIDGISYGFEPILTRFDVT